MISCWVVFPAILGREWLACGPPTGYTWGVQDILFSWDAPHSPTCPLRPLCHKYLLWSGPVHSDPTTHCLSRSNTHCLPCELMFRSFPRLDALGGQGPYCDLFFVQYVCSICDFILNFNFRGAVQEVFLVLWLLSLFSVGVVWNCLCFPF